MNLRTETNKNKFPSISAIVIAKNEEKKLPDCLKSISWVDEIVVVDTGSVDSTVKIAKGFTSKVVSYTNGGYSQWRNEGLKHSTCRWVLYVDADERVSQELKEEILKLVSIKNPEVCAYAIPRKNIILGRFMKHGGWWPDYVKRLFLREKIKGWKGDLHEEPVYEGNINHIQNPLIHIKHDNLSEMIVKTNKWSVIEARLLYNSNHPKMVGWRFLRIMLTELWLRLIKLRGFMDGSEGVIYSFYQMFSKFVTYAKLWEMQLNSKYSELKDKN